MKDIRWTICVPTVPSRRHALQGVRSQLEDQISRTGYEDIELLVLEDNWKREYGAKMQAMINIAQGDYVNFVDDDDRVSVDYVACIRKAMDLDQDCVGFFGEIRTNGGPASKVHYSYRNKQWLNVPLSDGTFIYYRNPQHLTPIKRELVERVPWQPHWHYGADNFWSHQMVAEGHIQSEAFVDAVLYHYDYVEGAWNASHMNVPKVG